MWFHSKLSLSSEEENVSLLLGASAGVTPQARLAHTNTYQIGPEGILSSIAQVFFQALHMYPFKHRTCMLSNRSKYNKTKKAYARWRCAPAAVEPGGGGGVLVGIWIFAEFPGLYYPSTRGIYFGPMHERRAVSNTLCSTSPFLTPPWAPDLAYQSSRGWTGNLKPGFSLPESSNLCPT